MSTTQSDSSPSPSVWVAWAEFLELTGAREARVTELVELGWLEPGQAEEARSFRRIDVYKTRKLVRLCEDFEISGLAGTIIVDLLERIAVLETRLNELER